MPFELPEEEKAFRNLSLLAAQDREGFRLSAHAAYARNSKQDRALLSRLETAQVTAYDVLTQWKKTLQPLSVELASQRRKPTFTKNIAKYLALAETEAEVKADALVEERLAEVREHIIMTLYPFPHSGQKDTLARIRVHARYILSQPETIIETLRARHSEYLAYQEVARLHAIDVNDPYDGWWRRQKATRRINKERKQTAKTEESRLQAVNERLDELFATHNGLVGEIAMNNWDIMAIFSLRQSYEKQLRLTESSTQNAAKRLVLFEKTVKTFRDSQFETIPSKASLTSAHSKIDDMTRLLIRVFELDNTEKNHLLLLMKEVRDLTGEKKHILSARAHRETLLRSQ